MDWRKQWLLYWTFQLGYITKSQQKHYASTNLSFESIIEKILSPKKIEKIKFLFILQCFLHSCAKQQRISEKECNTILQQKLQEFKEDTCNFSFDFLKPYAVTHKELQSIKEQLEEQNIFQQSDSNVLSSIFHIGVNTELSQSMIHKNFFPQDSIKHYKILEKIGQGGMGVVYKAQDTKIKRLVAIKAMLQKAGGDDRSLKRFQREIEISSSLVHPNIVRIYDFDMINATPYLVMQYIEGEPLLKYCMKRDISLHKKLCLVVQIASALDLAHKNNILHRDIKPSNIIVDKNGNAFLMDFGLAKSTEIEDKSLTRSGEVLGTPQYMAPEQAKGLKRELDIRTDIYELGAVLYHLLTGNPPAHGENLIEIVQQVITYPPFFSKEVKKQIPSSVRNICLRALEKQKAKRYQTAKAFAHDITCYLNRKSVKANSFYRKQMFLKGLKVLSLILLAFSAMYGFYFLSTMEASIEDKAMKYYEEGKKEKNFSIAYLKYIKALELLDKNKALKRKKRLVMKELFKNYYEQGNEILSTQPREALIYYERAEKWLTQFFSNNSFFQGWQQKIWEKMVLCAFALKDYKTVYIKGKTLPFTKKEIYWPVAIAAYKYQAPDCFERMQTVLGISKKGSLEYSGSLYYQGLIFYEDKNYRKARHYFLKALKSTKKKYFFTDSLYLSLCSIELIDIDKMFHKKKRVLIGQYLEKIESACLKKSLFYQYTFARYLFVILGAMDKPDKNIAKRLVALIDRILKMDIEKAGYYYIRSKAYEYMGKYNKAFEDCDRAYELDPSKIEVGALRLHLTCLVPTLERIENMLYTLLLSVNYASFLEVNLFEKEFKRIQKRYLQYKLSSSGMKFSQKRFEQFYKKLVVGSPEIQNILIKTISSMRPFKKLRIALSQKFEAGNNSEKKCIEQILKVIEVNRRQNDLKELFVRLTRQNITSQKDIHYFKRKIPILKQILFDSDAKLSPYGKKRWIFMRYRAAKALAYINEVRQELVTNIIENPKVHISSRILISETLYTYGLVYFSKDFLYHYLQEGDNTFLKVLALSSIGEKKSIRLQNIIKQQLQGKDELTTIAAAKIAVYYGISVKKLLFRVLKRGMHSKNELIRAQSTILFTSKRFFQNFGRNMSNISFFTSMVDMALKDTSPLVQFAILRNFHKLKKYYNLNGKKALRIFYRIIHATNSPAIKKQAIMASIRIEGVNIIDTIFGDKNSTFIDKVVAFVGSLKMDSEKSKNIALLLTKLRNIMANEKTVALKSIVMYSLSLVSGRMKFRNRALRAALFYGYFRDMLIKWIRGKNKFLKLIAMLSFANLGKIPPYILQELKNIQQHSQDITHKCIALGLLVNLYKIENRNKKSNRIHRWVKKKYCRENSKKAKLYRKAVIWGYKNVTENIADINSLKDIYITYKKEIDHEMIQFYSFNKKMYRARDTKVRGVYIRSLEAIIDILLCITKQNKHDERKLVRFTSELCSLYAQDKEKLKAVTLLEKVLRLKNWKDQKLLSLWVLYAPISKTSKFLDRFRKNNRKLSSSLLRSFAKIYEAQGKLKKAEECLYKQYYLNPRDPRGLLAIGHYYCNRRNNEKAYDILLTYKALFLSDWNKDLFLALARVAVLRDERTESLTYLNICYSIGLTENDLMRYPEFERLRGVKGYDLILKKLRTHR